LKSHLSQKRDWYISQHISRKHDLSVCLVQALMPNGRRQVIYNAVDGFRLVLERGRAMDPLDMKTRYKRTMHE